MQVRTLAAPLSLPWWAWWVLGVVVLNIYLVALGLLRLMAHPFDWFVLEEGAARFADGTLYVGHGDYAWVWSPIAAWLLTFIVPLGVQVWMAAHLAVLAFLHDWKLVALTLLSLPLWIDTLIGNSVTFIAVAGVVALRGSRWGSLVYLALCLLIPRPLQAPLAVYLLWKQPETRVPFAVMAFVSVALVAWSGYGPEWIAALSGFTSAGTPGSPVNLSPARFIGSAWLLVGVPLAVWLTWKGRVGWAGLALSPYILPMYPLVLLWELVPLTPRELRHARR